MKTGMLAISGAAVLLMTAFWLPPSLFSKSQEANLWTTYGGTGAGFCGSMKLECYEPYDCNHWDPSEFGAFKCRTSHEWEEIGNGFQCVSYPGEENYCTEAGDHVCIKNQRCRVNSVNTGDEEYPNWETTCVPDENFPWVDQENAPLSIDTNCYI